MTHAPLQRLSAALEEERRAIVEHDVEGLVRCTQEKLDALRALALSNYGHFTSMQVRNGAVQGRELHVRRLEDATQALFGTPLDGASALQQAAHRITAGHV